MLAKYQTRSWLIPVALPSRPIRPKIKPLPTTSPEVARRALQGLNNVHIRYAVLHSAHKLQDGDISDVDIAVIDDPMDVIRTARPAWKDLGLSPVLVCPYDIGGARAVFLASEDGKEGVQLDMLFDPRGIGKYGLRSRCLVDTAVIGPVPVVNEPARLIYLWRKRLSKGHQQDLEALHTQATAVPPEDLIKASTELTGSPETAESLLGRKDAARMNKRHPGTRFARLVGRILNPVGYWAHVADGAIARELADRLSQYLVVTKTGNVPPPSRQRWWHATSVWPTTLRPGIYLSHGNEPRWCPSPAVTLTRETADEAAPQLVAAMSARISR